MEVLVLRDADLRSADLRSADLRSADLRSADLRSADLRDADLRDADLRDADLRNLFANTVLNVKKITSKLYGFYYPSFTNTLYYVLCMVFIMDAH